MPTVRFIFSILRSFRPWIIGMLIIAIIWAIDVSFRPYLLKLILDRITTSQIDHHIDTIIVPCVLYLFFGLFMCIIFRIDDYIWLKLNSKMKQDLGNMLMEKMMKHTQDLFHNEFAGALANKIKDAMSGIPDLVKIVIRKFVGRGLALIFVIFTLSTISPIFGILFFVWVSVFVIGSLLFLKKAEQLSHKASEIRSKFVGLIVDILTNILHVTLFAQRDQEQKKIKNHLDQYALCDQERDWYFLKIATFQGLSFILYQAITLTLLLMKYKIGLCTAGDFALILSINFDIINLLHSFSMDVGDLVYTFGIVTQGLNKALLTPAIQDSPTAKELFVEKGHITFNNVHFQYKDGPILFQEKSISIPPGQKVGLVGYSGSGKSTFVHLILRLYDIHGGSILIDGQDIRDITQDSLRRNIGMIPQDPSLFHRSLMENIRYGKYDTSDEEVIQASKKASSHDFILNLKQEYNALVGERGVKLSGGQRQRVSIARTFLKNAPILILDEATSQLDSFTENRIQDALWELMQGKTTLIIAHRLSTLLAMDRILVFDKGKIVEDGTHKELLEKNGLYAMLWRSQIGGFLPEQSLVGLS